MTLDAGGRVPQFFLDNSINARVKIRLQDKFGVVQLASDGVLIIGPAGGTGGGGGGLAGDPSQLFQTGDLKARYGVGVHPGVQPGWVRANGMAIGSVTSTGFPDVERANADCHDLFLFLWNQAPFDGGLAVSGGRGANAATDWTAGKQIRLPDWRGYALTGLDDMGNTPAGRLTMTYWGGNPIVLGAVGGGESSTLALAQLPAGITSSGSNLISVSSTRNIPSTAGNIRSQPSPTTGGNQVPWSDFGSADWSGPTAMSGTNTISVTSNNTSAQPHRTIGPSKLCTFYLKL